MVNRKKLVSFAILFLALCFVSCSFFNASETASVSLSVVSSDGNSLARSVIPQALQGKFCEISLKGGYSETKTVLLDENASLSFSAIPVGIRLYAQVNIYEQTDTTNEKIILLEGTSDKVLVKAGNNKLSILLKRPGQDAATSSINLSVSLSEIPSVTLEEYEVRVRNSNNEMIQKFSVDNIDSPIAIENLPSDTYRISVLGCATWSDVEYVYYYQKANIVVSSGENKSSDIVLGNFTDNGTYIVIFIQPQGEAAERWSQGSNNCYSCTITGNGVNFTIEDSETAGNGNTSGCLNPDSWNSIKDKFLEPGLEYLFSVSVRKEGWENDNWNSNMATYTGSTTKIVEQSNYENQGSHAVTVNVE